ncbi:preprotein translocase subunit YajC [Streptomyces sp. H27-D2]|uniref:preprotein translocase subunit YajC n=1 Tax=Streptomyces sp. H27-D2 TaxID=3046304 RepID=UPI002DC04075|nr:preprotein translocase subunit YajC [Streptomyces sp. H27-D2]MEC4015578.1 preprotein translocase subunit YajC [Streptomyces sp. H27-D2]
MNIVTLLPFIVLIGAMFLMTRSAKNKQRAAAKMRNQMQPGSGVRTIGGMYATVKEVHDDSVHLEIAPGVHAIYAKNSIGTVLDDAEYNRIVHGVDPDSDLKLDEPLVPNDASSLTAADEPGDETATDGKIDLGKSETPAVDEAEPKVAEKDTEKDTAKDAKQDAKQDGKDGDTDAK